MTNDPRRPRTTARAVAAAARRSLAGLRQRRKVTVVVLGANTRHLNACLESVLEAGYRAVEVRLVGGVAAQCDLPLVAGIYDTVTSAIAAAEGEWLTIIEASETMDPGLLAAQVAAIRRDGSDVVVGGVVEQYRGAWRPVPADPALTTAGSGLSVADRPGLLTSSYLTGLLARTELWWTVLAEAGRIDPYEAAVVRLLCAAERITVLPEPVTRRYDHDRDRPTREQRRYRVSEGRRRATALAATARVVPPEHRRAWLVATVAHVLPEMFRDAVGGGPEWWEAIHPWIRSVVADLDENDLGGIPVEARLVTWAAAHGSWSELARVLGEVADNPHGLPFDGDEVLGDVATRAPVAWRRLGAADRVLRTRIRRVVVEPTGDLVVTGNAFVTMTLGSDLPQVVVAGRQAEVTTVLDPTADLWAERAFEGHADSGFRAVVRGGGVGSGTVVPTTISLGGQHASHEPRIDGPAQPRGVESVQLDHLRLLLAGTGPLTRLRLAGPVVTPWVEVERHGQTWRATVSLCHDEFGESVGIPRGGYDLHSDAGPVDCTGLIPPPPGERHGVAFPGGARIRLIEPLTLPERSVRGQQALRAGPYPAPGDALVVFESFRGRAISDNPAAICAELQRRDVDLDIGWVVDDPAVVVPEGTIALPRRGSLWHAAMSTAAGYVANAGAPPWWHKPVGQIHLQTWHGTPLKHIGEDRGPGDFWTWRHRRDIGSQAAGWDGLISPSPYTTPILRGAFGFTGEILEIGQPRNDILLADDGTRRNAVRERLGITVDQRVVLYAPTWREYGGVRTSKPLFLDARRVVDVDPGAVVLVRGHYNATREAEAHRDDRRIRDVTRWPDIADLYLAADVLVTDYSSVMFDFVLTDRPIILLTPDLERYRDVERGFYFDLATDAPGPLVTTTDEVVALLGAADEHAAARASYRARFCPRDDGAAAARAVDWLLAQLSG